MFGFSFSELVVVAVVALVVMGPKDLPKMLRRLGQWAGKIRRAAADLRAQSGIDDALRSEGLADDIAEIRKLARGELDAVQRAAQVDLNEPSAQATPQSDYGHGHGDDDFFVVRDREYPRDGADAYDALPDNAIVYSETLPKSPLARDPLYRVGDADAELPPEPEPEPGAAGPTLIGGVGSPVPYEPPGAKAADETPARVASGAAVLLGAKDSEAGASKEARKADEPPASGEPTTNAEARN